MVTIARQDSAEQQSRFTPARQRDDLSSHAHRQLIGYIGLFLPIVLLLLASVRPVAGLEGSKVLESVSAYYYTGAVAAFVGMLFALAVFLFTYRGYENERHWADRWAAVIGALAALGVAFFPTKAPVDVTALLWWTTWTGRIHHTSAVVLLLVFAAFSLFLFTYTPKDRKAAVKSSPRNHIYIACGLVIVACIAWAALNGANGKPIFLPEVIALWAFALSWLVKGYAHTTIGRVAQSATQSLLPTSKASQQPSEDAEEAQKHPS